jgi:hypothetical protein
MRGTPWCPEELPLLIQELTEDLDQEPLWFRLFCFEATRSRIVSTGSTALVG